MSEWLPDEAESVECVHCGWLMDNDDSNGRLDDEKHWVCNDCLRARHPAEDDEDDDQQIGGA